MKNHVSQHRLTSLLRSSLLALALAILAPASLQAQSPSMESEEEKKKRTEALNALQSFADSLDMPLAYTRERFSYPRFGRPPVIDPPAAIARKDTEIPTLILSAIVYDSDNPDNSVAILRIGDRAGQQRRVAQGDRIGQIEVEKITQKEVVIKINNLGSTRRQTLSLSKP